MSDHAAKSRVDVSAARALHAAGRHEEALGVYRSALALQPDDANLLTDCGVVLKDLGRREEAAAMLRRAVLRAPAMAAAWFNLGATLLAMERPADAVIAYRNALARQPTHPTALFNLGAAYHHLGRWLEAEGAYRCAAELAPETIEAWYNLGVALQEQGKDDAALRAYRRALDLDPDHQSAYFNAGVCLLRVGRYGEGWSCYEARFRSKTFGGARRGFPGKLEWSGEALAGRTLLVHAEQGAGDTIQFVRYAILLARQGERVVIECQRPLVRLIAATGVFAAVVAAGDTLPDFNVHCPMLSLPRHFGTTLESVPGGVPYLSAIADDRRRFRQRVAGAAGVKIGLAWAGNPENKNDVRRSIAPGQLRVLLDAVGARFFSLQVGVGEDDRADLGRRGVVDLTPGLADFADTAAAIAELDLVVSVDTAVAHLSGALGRPTWTLLARVPDWRWMHQRPETPWYPTMRLFRQRRAGDWSGPLGDAARSLAPRASAESAPAAIGVK